MNKGRIIKRAVIIVLMLVVLGVGAYLFVVPYITPVKVRGIFLPYDYVIDGSEVGIVRYKGEEEVVEIPEKIMFREVTKLQYDYEKGVFESNEKVKKVVMPDTIKIVEGFAFSRCENLEEVLMSENIEEIRLQSFGRCKALKSISLPEGLLTIHSGAFVFCDSLESIEIPSTVHEIRDCAFNGCTNLTEVIIPDTVSIISGLAFKDTPWYDAQTDEFVVEGNGVLIKYNGTSEVVEIPEGVRYIGAESVCNTEYFSKEQTIVVPKSVEEMELLTFWSSVFRKTIVLENDNLILADGAISDNGNTTIVAREGSTGHKYAEENEINWVALE